MCGADKAAPIVSALIPSRDHLHGFHVRYGNLQLGDPISRLVVCAEEDVSNTFVTPLTKATWLGTKLFRNFSSRPHHLRRTMPPPSSGTATATSVQVGTYYSVSRAAYPLGAVAHPRCRGLQRCGFDQRRRKIQTRYPSDSNEQSYTPAEITRSRSKQRAAHPPREHLASPPPHQKSRFLISTKSTTQMRHSTRYLPPQPSRSSPAS